MDYLTFSVAFTGFKAVSAVVNSFTKLKNLSDLPSEIQEDTFYLIHSIESIKPALELAILLHARQITAVHVSSAISLARKVLVECEAFIDSITSIDPDSDDDDTSSESEDENQERRARRARHRQKIVEYLSAPSQRDRLALLLRRLQLVLQALNLGITSASLVFPRHLTIHQLPFTFNVDAFQIALDVIRKMEMNRKFNTNHHRAVWAMTGNLHLFIIPSTQRASRKRRNDPVLTRLCHSKCVLSLEPKARKLDGKNVFAAFMTLHSTESEDLNDSNESDNDSSDDSDAESNGQIVMDLVVGSRPSHSQNEEKEEIDRKQYRMELDFLDFIRFRRFDPIYTKNTGEEEVLLDGDTEDIRDCALCYQWTFRGESYILEFESLDKFHLRNLEHPISSEVFECLVALLLVRSTFLESNSKTKRVVDNPSVLDQFVSVQDMVKMTKKILRFKTGKGSKESLSTPDYKIRSPKINKTKQAGSASATHGDQSVNDLAQAIAKKMSIDH